MHKVHSFGFVTEIPERVTKLKKKSSPVYLFDHFVFCISLLSDFCILLCFLFNHRVPSSAASPFSSSSSWPVGRPINQVFLLCPRRGFCMCADKMEASIGHINMQGPPTQRQKKSTARRLQRSKTFTLQGAKDEAVRVS